MIRYPAGIPLFGVSDLLSGTVRFVHAGTGSSSNNGQDPDRPVAMIDQAINKATATSSTYAAEDYVIVLPGHTETISAASGFDLDVAGVTVLGLGRGSLRPTLTYSVATSTGAVGANGTALVNLLHVASIDSLAVMIDIDATTGFLLEANEFRDDTSIGIIDTVDIADETDIVIRNNRWYETDAGIGQSCLLASTPTRLIVDDNIMDKDAQTGCVELGNAVQCRVINNWIETSAAEDLCIVLGTTSTGWIDNNFLRLATDASNITEAITVAANQNCQLGRNWVVNADGERALEYNGAQSTD